MESVTVSGKKVKALVDTGCSRTIVADRLLAHVAGGEGRITAVDGSGVKCKYANAVSLGVGERVIQADCLVLEKILPGVDVILGMDVIGRLGGVTVSVEGGTPRVQFGTVTGCVAAQLTRTKSIEDKDFTAEFDGRKWTVKWKWKSSGAPVPRNRVGCYSITDEVKEDFDKEVKSWIDEGILVPTEDPGGNILPLMAVKQENKGKVRPVLDFRNLNEYVLCHTGDSAVCDETLRR
jgi:hypothetical protein